MNQDAPRKRATIRIFLLDGTPAGPRTVERLGWTGHCIVCSRASYPSIRARPEFDRTGVYVLVSGSSDEDQEVYVGEADVARARLDDHLRNRDEWTHFVLFTSQAGHVNKALAKNIESRLVALGLKAKRTKLGNGNIPPAPQLHESDEAEVENFLEEMVNIYPLLGITAFQIPPTDPTAPTLGDELELNIAGSRARGRDLPEGFLVFRGAVGTNVSAPSFTRTAARELKEKLVQEGVLLVKGDEWTLTQDYLFNSSSIAAALLVGYPISGPSAWRNSAGKSLKEIESASLRGG